MTTTLSDLPVAQFIGGQWVDGTATMPVHNPATGTEIATVADGDDTTALAALDAAVAAQQDWAATDPRHRSDILLRAFHLLHAETERIARTITLEMGKPLVEARGEVAYGAEFLRWFAEETTRGSGAYFRAPSGGRRIAVRTLPVGPVFAITPWNFPLAMVTRKVAPALAAGCTVVLKPAPQTPLTALSFMQILAEAGVPSGVVNCVTTSRAPLVSGRILSDTRLRKLTFTGSTAVGRTLLTQAAQGVLRASMELGGNAPFVVLESADLDKAVGGAVLAKLRNGGQTCVAADRFLVHESRAAEFTERFLAAVAALPVGDGLDPATRIGPMIDGAAVHRISALIDEAVGQGAHLHTVGTGTAGSGHFLQPAVLTGVDTRTRLWNSEVFGPVAAIRTFTDPAAALHLANATDSGLAGYVFGENLSDTLEFAEDLQTGMVGVNTGAISDPAAPFGGMKSSGLGREGGSTGLEEYQELQYLAIER
ncbi:NAD-dependent succinate-semialdehyde dehydrogenase [Nocardia fluminea]|uniref:Succinate-semialdehyde dehydrogenase/glutarate-semialdehyde dehydrogenase n=1 Tax=Nocardia fluminea TaxID=134984 RepID=A0A2N3WXW2_9NOCA|nr:NAD-dependent succinate-semialdehyde dehydrogenase [Nocardia fluminea]PKV98697.1 succinate-semialdehyde dehydrogenase/glutarate-semialdehyde dehydrogenase [Nocardia fluminea]